MSKTGHGPYMSTAEESAENPLMTCQTDALAPHTRQAHCRSDTIVGLDDLDMTDSLPFKHKLISQHFKEGVSNDWY